MNQTAGDVSAVRTVHEPVACRREKAMDCFLRTKMDVLVLGDVFVERAGA